MLHQSTMIAFLSLLSCCAAGILLWIIHCWFIQAGILSWLRSTRNLIFIFTDFVSLEMCALHCIVECKGFSQFDNTCIYSVSGKKETKMFLVISQTKLERFSWNLIHGFLNKFAIKLCKRFPPHLNSVSTLPCKTWNAHCAHATIELIQKETPEFIKLQLWPSNSPDLTPVQSDVECRAVIMWWSTETQRQRLTATTCEQDECFLQTSQPYCTQNNTTSSCSTTHHLY